jgi:ADP-ribosylglycohydrolase
MKTKSPNHLSRTIGCMLGGAVGDALGAPVESIEINGIHNRYGNTRVTRFENAYGRIGAITDNTRMSLFTAEGLILSRVRREYTQQGLVIQAIYHAYLRWLYTQEIHGQTQLVKDHGTCSVIDGILTGHRELYSQRAPSKTCLSALRSGMMGTMDHPVNDSKGCGGVVRVAPIGLTYSDAEEAFLRGCESAAITHGHPTGYIAAGFLASLISQLLSGQPLTDAIADTIGLLKAHDNHGECLKAVNAAITLSRSRQFSPEDVESLGAGWVAEEVLAIGLYCALIAGNDFQKAVFAAVNHSGDSGSTGSITGNIVGAQYGTDVIPDAWTAELEMKDVIEELATDLAGRHQ